MSEVVSGLAGATTVAKAYDAACMPDLFLFDDSRPGNDVPVTGTDLRAMLNALLAGQDPLVIPSIRN